MAARRKQPLYSQLVDLLRDKIENEYQPGDMLPSERELSERYDLSRTTVRLALGELEEAGLITRQHGKGTFVADFSPHAEDLMGTFSFTEQMVRSGRVPRTEVLEFEVIEAPKTIAGRMGIRLGERVYRMRRLRLADEVPLMVERTYLPAGDLPGLTRHDLESRPLYDILEKEYHQSVRYAEEECYASIVQGNEAEQLDIPSGAPVLRLVRTTYTIEGRVVEFTQSIARADQFKYKVTHVRGSA